MAAAVHDPPVSVREKNDRVVVVFNVSNAKTGSVRTEIQPGESTSEPGALFVAFSSVSPVRKYEKRLQLPHRVLPYRIVSDIQSKCITVQLVKEEGSVSWGSTWVKETKGAKKGKKSSAPRGGPDQGAPVSPQNSAAPPPTPAAEVPAVELGNCKPDQQADDLSGEASVTAESAEQKDGEEDIATEAAAEESEEQVRRELSVPDHVPVVPLATPRISDNSSMEAAQVVDSAAESAVDDAASTSTAADSAAVDQKTPENIARLPPKLRERLLQRGILKEAEAAAAASLEAAKETLQPPAPEVRAADEAEDAPTASSSTAAKKKKKKRSQKQAAAANGKSDAAVEDEDAASTTASSSTPPATPVVAPAAVPAVPAAAASATAAAEKPAAQAARKKKSQPRQTQLEKKEPASSISLATPSTGASLDREGALPVLPPNDPEVTRLVQEALVTFAKDRKKATVQLRLASRKGYLTAYVVLAQLAVGVGDEPLMIEALCSLLQEEAAKKQLLPELLSKCALQLAAAMRDPQHADEVQKRRSQLQVIAKDWPIVLAAMDAHEPRAPVASRVSEKTSNGATAQVHGSSSPIASPSLAARAPDHSKGSKDDGAAWDLVLEAALKAFASAGTPPTSPSSSTGGNGLMAQAAEQSITPAEDGFDALD